MAASVTAVMGWKLCASLDLATTRQASTMNSLALRHKLFWYACICLVAAVAVRAGYALLFDPSDLTHTPHWSVKWIVAYVVFAAAYGLMPRDASMMMTARRAALLLIQTAAGVILVWLFPSFVVTFLLIIVVWQLALLLDFRQAFVATVVLVVIMGVIQCTGETRAKIALVIATCAGLQFFALCAAQLARSEIAARDELARANTELQAAQVILRESTRLNERLRIARDLHDVMGHTLTTLAIHLDVASRLAEGPAVEHVNLARSVAGGMLDQVRSVVSRFRVQPLDVRAALEKLVVSVRDLRVVLRLPPDLEIMDAARAETIIHCVQEVITNTLRHAHAQELVIDVRNKAGEVIVTTRDDGRGGRIIPGNGLAGMRERFEMLGGSLTIQSREGRGFAIRGVLPLAGSLS